MRFSRYRSYPLSFLIVACIVYLIAYMRYRKIKKRAINILIIDCSLSYACGSAVFCPVASITSGVSSTVSSSCTFSAGGGVIVTNV